MRRGGGGVDAMGNRRPAAAATAAAPTTAATTTAVAEPPPVLTGIFRQLSIDSHAGRIDRAQYESIKANILDHLPPPPPPAADHNDDGDPPHGGDGGATSSPSQLSGLLRDVNELVRAGWIVSERDKHTLKSLLLSGDAAQHQHAQHRIAAIIMQRSRSINQQQQALLNDNDESKQQQHHADSIIDAHSDELPPPLPMHLAAGAGVQSSRSSSLSASSSTLALRRSASIADLQRDECDALAAIFEHDFIWIQQPDAADAATTLQFAIDVKPPSLSSSSVSSSAASSLDADRQRRPLVSALLKFELPVRYPRVPPLVSVVSSNGMRESDLLVLALKVQQKANSIVDANTANNDYNVIIYDLVLILQQFLQEYIEFLALKLDFGPKMKSAGKRPSGRSSLAEQLGLNEHGTIKTGWKDYSAAGVSERDSIQVPSGLRDADLVPLPSAEAVLEHLYRVEGGAGSHRLREMRSFTLQPVFSDFLWYRFSQCARRMEAQLGYHLAQPELAFHGTLHSSVQSIIAAGLAVPGQRVEGIGVLNHRTDSGWYGRGIYLSPYLGVSLSYGGLGSTFICYVLMGRRYVLDHEAHGAGLQPDFDSHVAPGGNEYVLFDSDQVLPLYLIAPYSSALDDGTNSYIFQPPPAHADAYLSPSLLPPPPPHKDEKKKKNKNKKHKW